MHSRLAAGADARSASGHSASFWSVALSLVAVAIGGCAGAPARAPAPEEGSTGPSVVLSDEGKRYLENVFLFGCAPEYLPYPEGSGPPVPARSESERRARKQELDACVEDVADEYTSPDVVRMMTWDGTKHVLSEAERKGIVRDGEEFLNEYVSNLLQSERRREGTVGAANELATRS